MQPVIDSSTTETTPLLPSVFLRPARMAFCSKNVSDTSIRVPQIHSGTVRTHDLDLPSETSNKVCQSSSHERPARFRWHDLVSLTLENHGSAARDHLALERTFLAYVRTSITLVSSGVALVQLLTVAAADMPSRPTHWLHHYIRPLGAMTIVLGLVVLFMGVTRYFNVQVALIKGYFPVSAVMTALITLTLAILVSLTFAVLLAG